VDTHLAKGRILFLDDQRDAVEPYVAHLKSEGFTNVDVMTDVKALNQVVDANADLIFLDITGVATALNSADEGLSVLEYVKKHQPWTQVIVLSGSDFPASKAKSLSKADLCITKGSLNLAELVNVTEDQLKQAVAPEYRNVKILTVLEKRIEDMNLGWWKKKKLRKLIAEARAHEGDPSYDWNKLVSRSKETLSVAANVAKIVAAFSV